MREQMAAFLRQQGVDAVCAYPEERRRQRSWAGGRCVPAGLPGRAGGFRDYLGERYDESTGQWQELYGRPGDPSPSGWTSMERALGSSRRPTTGWRRPFSGRDPAGLALRELSCGETEFDRAAGLYRRAVTAVCQGYLYAVADEGGTFLDFVVRGEGHL